MAEPKKRGRKGGKVRINITLGESINAAAEFIGKQTFGNKSAYLDHLVMSDLERQNYTLKDIMDLAEKWRQKHGPTSGDSVES